jgi:Icc protein
VKIYQITDCHLFPNKEQVLRGEVCYQTLSSILAEVHARIDAEDILVFTGDLTDSGEIAAYQHLRGLLEKFPQRKIFLPGNHDLPQRLTENLGDLENSYCAPCLVNLAPAVMICLDSTIAGEIDGEVATEQLQLLRDGSALAQQQSKPALVFIHHQTLSVDGYMDRYSVRNADEFLAAVDRCENIKAVVCGHIHQEFDQMRQQCRFLGSPSTCYQIQVNTHPSDEEDIVDPDRTSGYRTLWLEGDAVRTAVHRL